MKHPDLSEDQFIREWEPTINQLTEKELIYLNRLILHKVKMIRKANNLMAAARFNVGERVSFNDQEGKEYIGKIIRINQKTISVEVNEERYYKVHPSMLRKTD